LYDFNDNNNNNINYLIYVVLFYAMVYNDARCGCISQLAALPVILTRLWSALFRAIPRTVELASWSSDKLLCCGNILAAVLAASYAAVGRRG